MTNDCVAPAMLRRVLDAHRCFLASDPSRLHLFGSICMHAFSYDTRSRPPFLCASRTRPSVMQASSSRWWLKRTELMKSWRAKTTWFLLVLTCSCTQSSYDGPISFSPPQMAASATGCGIPARSTSIGLICPVATRQFQGYCKPRLISGTSVLCCLCSHLLC